MFEHEVQISWKGQSGYWWNECCIAVIEVFGLPGQRFIFSPLTDHMSFKFKSEKDANLCRILLSEKF